VGAAPGAPAPDEARLREVLALLRDAGLGPARAADVAAALGAAPRNRAYREALAGRERDEGAPGEPH
jgi:hypothetical protein